MVAPASASIDPSPGPAGTSAAARALPENLIAPPGRCAGEEIASTQQRARAIRAMVCLTNYARRQSGRSSYGMNAALGRSASSKAADILRCDAFSHTACGRPFTWWIEKRYAANARCWRAGENIAWGASGLGTPRRIFRAWMASPGHRAAILSAQYQVIGVGFRSGRLGKWDSARVWVQHFGQLC